MGSSTSTILKRSAAAGMFAVALFAAPNASSAQERPLYIAVGDVSRPDGWARRMARHGAEPDKAQDLTEAEVRRTGPPR